MAGALVGGAFLSAVLQVVFDRMASREVSDFFQGRKLTGRLLDNLNVNLRSVAAVLEDAEEKQVTNRRVKEWLDDLKDAVHDAEDILDEIATEVLRRKLDAEFQTIASKVRNCISASIFATRIEGKIKEVLEKLELLGKQKDLVGLLQNGARENQSENFPTTSLVEESGIFGRHNEKKAIIDLLLSDDRRGSQFVIALVGMGGIGKTTVAQLVYNDNRVNEFFNLKSWFCVSKEFAVSKVKKSILEVAAPSACGIEDPDRLQVALKKNLTGKKFLVVLDDVWTEKSIHQEFLSELLQYGAQRSRILITTRSTSVANAMHAAKIYWLEQLLNEDSWLLFTKHAFRDGSLDEHPALEEKGRKIVEKCRGLPIAIKAVGDLLCSKLDVPEYWNKILESDWRDLPMKETIFHALRLSYRYLPPPLKRCFSYCSIFPVNYDFRKDQVVLLWMAEGFLKQSDLETMEEVGDHYFDDLVSRSFFQQVSGSKLTFTMHDLVNEFAKSVAGQFSLTLETDSSHQMEKRIRHLSYFGATFETSEKIDALCNAKLLRTFLPLDSSPWQSEALNRRVTPNLSSMLRCLRVLSLSQYQNMSELPDSISKIEHLRYLDLSFTKIESLPNSICKLCNLQTLKLLCCLYLATLPKDLKKLISLRHLNITKTKIKEMPIQMGRLKCLQTLTKFIISQRWGSGIGELGLLNDLRGTLSILELQNIIDAKEALNARLKDKKHLEELVLEWNADTHYSESQRTILENLKPNVRLKSLTIRYYGGTIFPGWVGDPSFSNIASLHLENCKNCSCLPPLGQLPSLQELFIVEFDGLVTVSRGFYGSDSSSFNPFGALKVLRFEKMSNWEDWISFGVENKGGAFPCLEELYIWKCPKLKGGLAIHLPSLAKLEIIDCPELMVPLSKASVDSLPRAPAIRKLEIMNKEKHLLLEELPNGTRKLQVEEFNELRTLEGIMDSNSCIQELEIKDCRKLVSLSKGDLPSTLKSMVIEGCWKLALPEDLDYYSLETLRLKTSCSPLEALLSKVLVASLRSAPVKCELEIINGKEHLLLTGLPTRMWNLKVAGFLKLKSLGGMIGSNSRIQELEINDCRELVSLYLDGLPLTLRSIGIEGCRELELPVDLDYSSLETMRLRNSCSQLVDSLSKAPVASFLRAPPKYKLEVINGEGRLLLDTLPTGMQKLRVERFHELQSLEGMMDLRSCIQELEIIDCRELVSLSGDALPSALKSIVIEGCLKLKVPKELHKSSLEKLRLRNSCSQLVDSLSNRSKTGNQPSSKEPVASFPWTPTKCELKVIHGEGCILLTGLPTGMQKLKVERFHELKSLEGMMGSGSIQQLAINDCRELVSLSNGGLPSTLGSLEITRCTKLKLTMGLYCFSIERLELSSSCDSLTSFPLDLFPRLCYISIGSCGNLDSLALKEEYEDDLMISNLQISDCIKFVSFPNRGLRAPSLTEFLIVSCRNLRSLPVNMHLLLPSLEKLTLVNCPEIESFPERGLPSNVKEIVIENCDKLIARRRGWGLQNLLSLILLSIRGKAEDVESFPEAGLLPTCLISLRITDFPSLKYLNENGLQHLTSLKSLTITQCPKLEKIPEEGLPATLSYLSISKCPLLKSQWEGRRGKGWRTNAFVDMD